MRPSIVVAYFTNPAGGLRALKSLRRQGFRRVALLSKRGDGRIRRHDPFLMLQLIGGATFALFFGLLSHLICLRLSQTQMLPTGGQLPLLAGGAIGFIFSLMVIRRPIFGIEQHLLKEHSRWLIPGETVVILRVPTRRLTSPMALLRESDEPSPAIFFLTPRRKRPFVEAPIREGPLSEEQMREFAVRLAKEYQLAAKTKRRVKLLKRYAAVGRQIHRLCRDLSEATREGQSTSPLTEWLLDNEYIIEGNLREVRLNLPWRYYEKLPRLDNGPYRGLPRIYALAKELVLHTNLHLDKDKIISFCDAYQQEAPLSIGELWALPQMFRIALIEGILDLAETAIVELRERQIADFWANRLITASRRDPSQIFLILSMLAELAELQPTPSPYFAFQLIDNLYDYEAPLVPVRSWLEGTFRRPLAEINQREQNRQARNLLSISNAFTSLRLLSLLDWRKVFERLCQVEHILERDPAGVYPDMDFDTRDRYRQATEDLARRSGVSEATVAQHAVALAKKAIEEAHQDDRWHHVGMYLIGEGRRLLLDALECREAWRARILHWVKRHHTPLYLLSIFVLSSCIVLLFATVVAGAPLHVLAILILLCAIPASQIGIEVVNYLVTRLIPPRPLPKMDFERSGIPDEFRTLVVVPTILVDEETIDAEIERLEVRYLANKEDNLLFALFSDYRDAPTPHETDDERLLGRAIAGIAALNERHGSDRFYLFHRERAWSETEKKFIGWERKRGKLEELNRLLDGSRPEEAARLVYVGDPNRLWDVRFVITLDSDTQLPPGSARRLIETLAHPLNRPRFDASGRVAAGTYTIIQPRLAISLPSAHATPFSRIFADAVGVDPYTKAVSDVYMDLAAEGSYQGKGIYDVRAFSHILSGRFPEGRLLSHDLLEGAHVRVGLATDIELYEEFPRDYLSYSTRQHRWIRGDWQIVDWVTPRVPMPGGKRGRNPLGAFDRWKILDNIRRSLVPPLSMLFLVSCWLWSLAAAIAAGLVVSSPYLFRPLTHPITWLTTRGGIKQASWERVARELWRGLLELSLLPHQAWLAADAICRVWYRLLISHRKLLEWTPAHIVQRRTPERARRFVAAMAIFAVADLFAMWVQWSLLPQTLPAALPWLIPWSLAPLVAWWLTKGPVLKRRLPLEREDLEFLKGVARRTWRYFAELVGEKTSWLPPDNYQVAHRLQLAMRTSPTNIGLWMLSVLAAHDFGYLTVDQATGRLQRTLETVAGLERYNGHLFNWYDIETLTPLEPRYVSTVDSGNLLACLWTLTHGLDDIMDRPLLDARAFSGIRDTAATLGQLASQEAIAGLDARTIDALIRACEHPPEQLPDAVALLQRLQQETKVLYRRRRGIGGEAKADYWARELGNEVAAWLRIVERYLSWAEIMAEKRKEELSALGTEIVAALRVRSVQAPSLRELAYGRADWLETLRSQTIPTHLADWVQRLITAWERAQAAARDTVEVITWCKGKASALADAIDMRFLYDAERRLFAIGFNVTAGRLDSGYYDLLASEARLGSFIAVARGDAPLEHWFSLGRPYGSVRKRSVLLSWAGSMFEYLMPLIFQRTYPNTLLDRATLDAITIHMEYGRRHRLPWGISESAFGELDVTRAYQYKAFGVPELGLKRGLEEELVVAPYATLLALAKVPRQAVHNLKRLARAGLLDDYGYYEAIDYKRRPGEGKGRGVIVRAYMTHHQGMGFLSLANCLHDNFIQRLFHEDARVQAVEALLQERIPLHPPLHHVITREGVPGIAAPAEVAPSVSTFETPHTSIPKTQLLSNGHYSIMVTNAGGGYSRWGNFEITRWRSDRTRDPWGSFCYIHEPEQRRLWSNTYQPTCGDVNNYTVHFSLDRAIFKRTDHDIKVNTEVIVSPEDDVEIRRITITNQSMRTRRLELTTYMELSMAPHNADRQHPAFMKLFIETEADHIHRALLAHRRPRDAEDPPIWVGHAFVIEGVEEGGLQFETDRQRFIGRGHSLANPLGATQRLGNSEGFVLDPIFSLRRDIVLSPGQRVHGAIIVAAGETRQDVLGAIDKYRDPRAIDQAANLSQASAYLELRLLHIQPDDTRRFQQLASHLLFPNPMLHPPVEGMDERCKGQAGLWPYGISGDLPIALVTIADAQDIPLVRQMLQAHTYWRNHGLLADLVILNEEAGGYERPLRERLERHIQTYAPQVGVDQPGGIYLRNADQMPEEDVKLLKMAARVVLVAARGTLPQQLSMPQAAAEQPEPLPKRRAIKEPSAALPFMELVYFNGLGGFKEDGGEYVIYLDHDANTPAPWVNVIANRLLGTLVSERGGGFTWYGNSQRNRVTEWSNDPLLDPTPEVIYIRDEDSGYFWTPTPAPIREMLPYRVRHGTGYTVFEHNSNGLEQELCILIPMDDNGGIPIKLLRLRLRNETARPRNLTITYYVEWTLGEHREEAQMHVETSWERDLGAILAYNRYHPDYREMVAFAAISPTASSYSGDRTAFIGRNRSLSDPIAMQQKRLNGRTGGGLDPCAALQVKIALAPGEQTEIRCVLGEAKPEELEELVRVYLRGLSYETILGLTRTWWDRLLGTIEVHTPEPAMDLLFNRWLLYQTITSRIWGRASLYQPGGAYGFRDQLQDVTSLLYSYPQLAREHIIRAAGRQFKEGDVQHWWLPPSGVGIRTRISDDHLWLPYSVSQYVRVTGDIGVLNEEIPFLEATPLEEDQREAYGTPTIARERATLLEHCRLAIQRALSFGPHGLPVMGTGDWNDGMNLVGAGGKGESVWLGWFLAYVLEEWAQLSDHLGNIELAEFYRNQREGLIRRIEEVAWDGKWYLRGIFDDGTLLGSAENDEGKIDSLPQSWAWICGGGDPERAKMALDAAWRRLVRSKEGLALLLDPPFDKAEPSPGYIRGYPPGVRENGGQYTHAAIWLAIALARSGAPDRAIEVIRMLNPIERARDEQRVMVYRIEPYAIPADVYNLSGRVGQGGWSWYTGAAAWLYRTWLEVILGLKVQGDRMWLDPLVPGNWDRFSIRYRYGDAVYDITVENPQGITRGVAQVELDGRRLQDRLIPLERTLVRHHVLVRMGKED